ncbi:MULTISPECIES: DUF6537 domain-containing protein [unclassified Streptomyces]|uniref:DUF6537 domain-containing protein n=1 Tax=unclassified Streptomyces TaxID=2593676 RepID=UPI00381EC152
MSRKIVLGPWFRPAFRILAALRRVGATRLHLFGAGEARRTERAPVVEFEASQGGGTPEYWMYSGVPATRRGAVAVVPPAEGDGTALSGGPCGWPAAIPCSWPRSTAAGCPWGRRWRTPR